MPVARTVKETRNLTLREYGASHVVIRLGLSRAKAVLVMSLDVLHRSGVGSIFASLDISAAYGFTP